jgi:methylglutaconyl-CoA hydratase
MRWEWPGPLWLSAVRFGFPEVRIGFVPAMVMAVLRRSVGEKKGFELITTGDEISAEEAERLGLANHVFDDQTFKRDVEDFVRKFEKISRSAQSDCPSGCFIKLTAWRLTKR